MKIFFMALLYVVVTANAKIPDWATNNSTKLSGSMLTTVCYGIGPTLDIARADAINSCQLSASQFFNARINIKSLTVESEKSIGYHQEISSDEILDGLVCNPMRDQVEELESQFKIWIQCEFDLKKVRVESKPLDLEKMQKDNINLEANHIKIKKKDFVIKRVYLSSVPKCESVLITGARSRAINCNKNPLEIEIFDGDSIAIVRTTNFKPKEISLNERVNNETIQVLLDK